MRTTHETGCSDKDRAKAVDMAIYKGVQRPKWLVDVTRPSDFDNEMIFTILTSSRALCLSDRPQDGLSRRRAQHPYISTRDSTRDPKRTETFCPNRIDRME